MLPLICDILVIMAVADNYGDNGGSGLFVGQLLLLEFADAKTGYQPNDKRTCQWTDKHSHRNV